MSTKKVVTIEVHTGLNHKDIQETIENGLSGSEVTVSQVQVNTIEDNRKMVMVEVITGLTIKQLKALVMDGLSMSKIEVLQIQINSIEK